ncbi:NAD(P)H-dependent oxidoreductase [Candidatus Bipolaricaulota bacterium]|nr:NAD(P)H-dependent oxidoreductase [Candidatus Bipolaricaulota bacterium]
MHVLIVHHSRTGNTEKLAQAIAAGVKRVAGVDCVLKPVAEIELEDLFAADGIIAGSPSYYGTMASELKEMFDRIFNDRPKMLDKIGAAFATAGHPTGGCETTMVAILEAMLVCGMLVCSDPPQAGGHYGVGSVGVPGDREIKWANLLGERVASLVLKMSSS